MEPSLPRPLKKRAAWVLLLGVLFAFEEAGAAPIERTSDPLLSASEAWEQAGFRFQLRFGREELTPSGDAPFGGGLSLVAAPSVRLSRFWSVGANLRYAVIGGEMSGLRWTTTADLGFHPFSGLSLAAGVGYGGLMVQPDFGRWASCTGAGPALLGQLSWLFPVGELFATGPMAQVDVQWTRCASADDDYIPLAEPPYFVERAPPSRSWRHRGLQYSWVLAWR